MKKLVTIFLALAMILSLSIPALATDEATLIINDSEGRTYAGYQLLTLTTSLKTGEHHPATCDNVSHTSDCYNFAYTVNAKYRTILQEETYANGGNYLWEGSTKPAAASAVTDAQILQYLANQTSDNGDTYHTMRQVADRVYNAILTAGIAADEVDLESNDSIAQGYWMFADVTDLSGAEAANSLVMVNTMGQSSLTITPKTSLPTIEKKVKDIEDSEDNIISDNAWHDSADHDINDTVPFKLTATLPSNAQYYSSYELVFHDTMSAGLTLIPSSIKVLMYETAYKASVDTDLNDAQKDVTAFFVPTTSGLTDGCTFEVACENLYAIEGVTKDSTFVVYYEATLNEGAEIGAAGNPNEVYLEFSNDPYGDTTGTTESDKVIVFTYQMVVNKTDSHGHALAGAGFTLYKKVLGSTAPDQYEQVGEVLGGEGSTMTTFTWTGLDDGDYKLVESTVPEGYNKMSDIVFSISASHSETADEPVLISLDGGVMGTGVVDTGAITKAIENNTGTVLPSTGAKGTFMLITVSTVLVMMAAVFMITRKKMSIYED